MLPVLYQRQMPDPGEDYSGPHDLALVFIVFAIGALLRTSPARDAGAGAEGGELVEVPWGPAQAEHYYQIGKAALSLQPVLEKPSIVTIQSLHLMSVYNAMSGSDMKSETSMEMTWSLVTLAAHLSQTIGLRECY